MSNLENIAKQMVTPGKGILAADESSGTIKKRFDTINVESTEENRRDYREILFQTKNAMENYISGVILFDETIRQKSKNGPTLVEVISNAGSLPGIKVDTGAKDLAFNSNEKVTEGLDGLRERLIEYYNLGAKFAKWRAVITIESSIPSDLCINANAHALARYAALCQENEIVPIVEPEVLMDGAHTIDRCYEVTKRTLEVVFSELVAHGVNLKGICLKPNMVIDGTLVTDKSSPKTIAEKTISCFKEVVPEDVPGIVFLSGGQSEIEATENLDQMNKIGNLPWNLSFSYGRALQASALQAWSGKVENEETASMAFNHRAEMNSLATLGKWDAGLEK
ncbi:MAG: class I fructose-bisphosphate aldolase [Pseudomonadota bacterium]|jgi:fructose-bisphosphate aldolase class I|nr:class I fructose-bisphosphate aldolase [Pseudomonadota bacterium]MED5254388.1 class I fructose-bisphosphate aldolase [Pseudomonadota bacterium]MED5273227.1 class I fructose-bisphosphate aldolase [Pseudomonadota bacterium]MED5484189.1 class I fructose-bisphosphate aldolase [Pseudomonadota bacterium]|tara:strand:+ start:2062 stop:3072 length:1011 start_codon:yes stop_codon:yes gene_type:complete